MAIYDSQQMHKYVGLQDDKNPAHCQAGTRQTAKVRLVAGKCRVVRGHLDAECPI
jgi:hypothetical protein